MGGPAAEAIIFRNVEPGSVLYWRHHPQEDDPMLMKSIIVVSTLALATSAFAAGVSQKTPGHKMQHAATSTAPGASEYAPGHKKMRHAMRHTKKSPGASAYAPGHETTGSATTKSATTKKGY